LGSVTVSSGNGSCFFVNGPNTLTVSNIVTQNNGVAASGHYVASGATLYTINCESTGFAWMVFWAGSAAIVSAGSHTFNGSASGLFFGAGTGTVYLQSAANYTFAVALAVSSGVAYANGGNIQVSTTGGVPTFTNPSFVSGPKYSAIFNGVIDAPGLGVNFFPGTVAGSTSTGGQYAP
jgi:hypothetical protein